MKKPKNKQKKKTQCELDSCDEELITTKLINWSPGHMIKATKKILEKLKMVDIVLEIRDARSPLVTGNESINFQMGEKSRLIVLNKNDLADPKILKLWTAWFSKQEQPFVFINCFNESSLKEIIKISKEIVNKKNLQSNPDKDPKTKLRLMIVGLPNTGKSTLINKLANRNATKVANKPAQTRHILWVKARKDLEIMDTPGVIPPEIQDNEQGIWLNALHAIPDRIVEEETTACYIVEHLLKTNPTIFIKKYKIEDVSGDLVSILDQIAQSRGCIRKKNEYDYERVYKLLLHDFRAGDLGPISFGLPPID